MKQIKEYMMQSLDAYSTMLNEYLSTKVKMYTGFPRIPRYNDIVEFLESHRFTRAKLYPEAFFFRIIPKRHADI